ncbi:NrfD/PsrC family molybdoenzyme membrane anchor subunit [Brachybacterium sp. GCM10030268]|uniref:NrfD/PsrC family molybdoenzyme membrane anchor subunit n=1 Tax=Brachybacterium sp. GCM10030268 TaxID=3273382 RepID=UPI00360B23A1
MTDSADSGRAVTSEFDDYRPPEPARRGRRRRDGPPREPDQIDRANPVNQSNSGGGAGSNEPPSSTTDGEFDSYYGRPVVKAPPWEWPIGLYFFVGGLAGGSALLGAGAAVTGRPRLRRNSRLTALGAVSIGLPALVYDLGRPERFLYMLRVFKPSSPMSMGTWLLTAFGTAAGFAAAGEVDRMSGERLPLGRLRPLLRVAECAGGTTSAVLGGPLAAYTATLLGDTAVPTWAASRKSLAYVFVSSASLAAGGTALVTTPVRETGPARALAVAGVVGDLVATRRMRGQMHPLEAEPLESGSAGWKLKLSEGLAIAGGLGALLAGRSRPIAAASGLALAAASALTRFGVLEAGLESVKDPRRTIEPQRERLERRRAEGVVDDSITTGPRQTGGRPDEPTSSERAEQPQ